MKIRMAINERNYESLKAALHGYDEEDDFVLEVDVAAEKDENRDD